MSNNIINIGVVGGGKLGTYHIQKLLKKSNSNLIGIYDSNPIVMENHKKEYNINIFDNLDSLIKKCNAIIIAAPTSKHYEISKYALKKGVHIFIEKPITNNLNDAIELISIAEEKNRIIL